MALPGVAVQAWAVSTIAAGVESAMAIGATVSGNDGLSIGLGAKHYECASALHGNGPFRIHTMTVPGRAVTVLQASVDRHLSSPGNFLGLPNAIATANVLHTVVLHTA